MNWPLAAALMALAALAVPDLLWGLAVLAVITGTLAILQPRGTGRAVMPLALVSFTVAAVEWIRLHGVPF